MKKVNANELISIEESLSSYDFEALSPKQQKSLLVRFKSEVSPVTYSDLQFGGSEEDYKNKEKILLKFIKELYDVLGENYCIVRKYNEKWVVNKDLSPELVTIMTEYSVTNKFNGGILVEKEEALVDLFIQSVLKYNSFVQFIFQADEIIISPTDHLDVFVNSKNLELLEDKVSEITSLWGKDMLELATV